MINTNSYHLTYTFHFNPFTPESDQPQTSPAASQEYDITQYGELDFS